MKRESLPKSYDSQTTEAKWRQWWVQSELSVADRASTKEPFSIVIPPPNVTGKLHMGHALVQTVQDILARFHRMRGKEVMWVPGTDHAGIATQTVVERHLMQHEGLKRTQMKREEFLTYCWKWKVEYEGFILDQIKLLGSSCDWSMTAFTMDESRSKAVRTAFKRLFDKGLIYRGDYLVNWDPVSRTALADDEVEYEERQSFLWQIRYPLNQSDGFIEVATTRPETLLGDVAIAVHPDDPRYQGLIGSHALLPLLDRKIPIIADRFVDPEFGTGAVKITPAHDHNDYQMALRHDLAMINILREDGRLNEAAGPYADLTTAQAREKIVANLTHLGLLVKTTPHINRVGVSYRSKAVIEPMLSKQWFVKLSQFKGLLREAVESKRVELIPAVWESTYFHWIDNLRDWCISRQLWWGHRIPIWYHIETGRVLCHDGEDLPSEVAQNPNEWQQDPDVLDTWFSSGLWPLSVMGWPDSTQALEKFYPTSVLVTGHDILFFWVARMMLMCELMSEQMPFSKVYLHGLIFAKSYWREQATGGIAYVSPQEQKEFDSGKTLPKDVHSKWEKMSKSKGNVIDPVEIIESFGADAMRMALASSLGDARQIDLDRRRFEEYKNFSNKLFNSARFVFMNIDNEPPLNPQDFSKGIRCDLLLTEDRWIIQQYQQTVKKVTEGLERFEFASSAHEAYSFFWDEFCAYYLEISKPVLWGKSATPEHRLNKQKLLCILLCGSLRMLHPFAPFITEELMSHLRDRLDTACLISDADWLTQETLASIQAEGCIVAPFPKTNDQWDFSHALNQMQILREIIFRIRQLRAEMNVPTGSPTDLLVQGSDEDIALVKEHEYVLRALLPLKQLLLGESATKDCLAAQASMGSITLIVPLPLEMAQAEITRLSKQRLILEENIALLSTRLNNEAFVAKAPQALVEKQRQQLGGLESELQALLQQLTILDTY